MFESEVYGHHRDVNRIILLMYTIGIAAAFLSTITASVFLKAIIMLIYIMLIVIYESHNVVYLEFKRDCIKVETGLSSFSVALSDITIIREHRDCTNIWFKDRFGPYCLGWGVFSRQELLNVAYNIKQIIVK